MFAGEVGLSGEIRAVSRIEQRVLEAEKLGFQQIFVPAGNKKSADKSSRTYKSKICFPGGRYLSGVIQLNRLFILHFLN